ncbi:hypothetical protein AVEN_53550-1 [Araneus ventricosus]|uniref:Uncharacterized protein n=1 Tax=Araneus ventricosus TaxID=182803 RepID=A0A4Y2U9H0_ARAVE|nr:hypothetical protein AVEN_53550-1 [Araneus ventricosus]
MLLLPPRIWPCIGIPLDRCLFRSPVCINQLVSQPLASLAQDQAKVANLQSLALRVSQRSRKWPEQHRSVLSAGPGKEITNYKGPEKYFICWKLRFRNDPKPGGAYSSAVKPGAHAVLTPTPQGIQKKLSSASKSTQHCTCAFSSVQIRQSSLPEKTLATFHLTLWNKQT